MFNRLFSIYFAILAVIALVCTPMAFIGYMDVSIMASFIWSGIMFASSLLAMTFAFLASSNN